VVRGEVSVDAEGAPGTITATTLDGSESRNDGG
jgi:hypothetical protein